MLTNKFVTEDDELIQIAALSMENMSSMIPDDLKEKEGYVTWPYSIEDLRVIHQITPSIVIKDDDKVIAYLIILVSEVREVYQPLKNILKLLGPSSYQDRLFEDYKYYILGQDCVQRDYRGRGLIKLLFDFQKKHLAPRYDLGVSAISVHNPLSQRIHEKLGAQVINVLSTEENTWNIVIWDWRILSAIPGYPFELSSDTR